MSELPLIFVSGLLGSAHCVGMCGGFALMVGAGARGWGGNVGRQLTYGAGRIFTYSVCGGALGFAGLRLAEDLPNVVRAQATLALLAGVLLVAQGLVSAGVISRGPSALGSAILAWWRSGPSTAHSQRHVACMATGLLGAFLRAPGLGHALLAGMLTGFLPCGLVYAFLALAATSGGLWSGSLTMVAFGLGTMPLMVLAGSGAALVPPATRVRLLRLAAWCVVIVGLLSLARGFSGLSLPAEDAQVSCPLCQ